VSDGPPRTDDMWALWYVRRYFGIDEDEDVSLPRMREMWEVLGQRMYMEPLNAVRQEWFHCVTPPYRMVPLFFESEKDLTLLDFGCGTAEFERKRWVDLGRPTTLIDLDGPNFGYLKDKFFHLTSVTYGHSLDLVEDESMDRVVCVDVFEHVPDPIGMAKAVWAKLKPGGQALLWFDPSYPHPGHLKDSIAQRPRYKEWLRRNTQPMSGSFMVDWVAKKHRRRLWAWT